MKHMHGVCVWAVAVLSVSNHDGFILDSVHRVYVHTATSLQAFLTGASYLPVCLHKFTLKDE